MKVYPDIIQGSDAWLAFRIGKPSASRASDIITAAKGDYSKSARKYICSLIADCFSPEEDVPKFETLAMTRGKDLEPVARDAFRAETCLPVVEVGFVMADDGICGCSPDGLIHFDNNKEWCAGLEIKCPLKEVHAEYVFEGALPDSYKQQVHWSLAVTGLPRWHFWSFHPRLKPLHVIVERDAYTVKVESAMAEFVKEYREIYGRGLTDLCIPVELLERKTA